MTAPPMLDDGLGSTVKGRGRYDVAFAAARIAVGSYWLYEQHWKLPPDFGLHDARGLMFAFEQSMRYPTVDLYRVVLQEVVVPHFHVFGWLLLLVEVAIGASLVLGVWTRAGALLGVLQAANLLVAQGRTPEGPWVYAALLVANLAVLFTPSNRRFSIDAWRARRSEFKSGAATVA